MDDFYQPSYQSGLTYSQVQSKKQQGKQNVQPEKATKSTGQILKSNICTLFNLFNLLIAVALALVGAWSNMLFILIIALNTLIGIVQELHAKKLVEELSLFLCRMSFCPFFQRQFNLPLILICCPWQASLQSAAARSRFHSGCAPHAGLLSVLEWLRPCYPSCLFDKWQLTYSFSF